MCLATQETPHFLIHLKIQYCVHNSLPLIPILNLTNPDYPLSSYFLLTHFLKWICKQCKKHMSCHVMSCHVMSCLSVYLSAYLPAHLCVHMQHLNSIGWIFATAYTGEFYYIRWKNQILFKIRQKYGQYTWRPKSIFWQYLTQSPTPVMRAHRGCNRSKAMAIRLINFTYEMYECASCYIIHTNLYYAPIYA
jgi:hypothetical protein